MKKTTSLILCIVMLVSILPVCAFAKEYDVHTSSDGNWKYIILDDGTISITAYGSDDPVVWAQMEQQSAYLGKDCSLLTVPPEIDGYTVSVIGHNAFYKCNSIIKVTLPDTIKSIESSAFRSCNLEEIDMQPGIETIGDYAFADCTKLKSITFKDGLKSVGDRAFYDCDDMEEANFPNSVEQFGQLPFMDCWKMRTFKVPASLSEIRDKMFAYTGLQYIEIPSNIRRIGKEAFLHCQQLYGYNLILNEGLEVIDDRAFNRSAHMNSGILIPKSVISIGEDIFSTGLAIYSNPSIKVYKNSYAQNYAEDNNFYYKIIDKEKFEFYIEDNNEATLIRYVGLVEDLVVPDTYEGHPVTAFLNTAFADCPNLKNLTLPASVTTVYGMESDSDALLGNRDEVTVYGYLDSYAQRIAEASGYRFEYLDEVTHGDIDGDGEISSSDYSMAKNMVLFDNYAFSNFQQVSADVNKDKVVDGFDVTLLDLYVNGIVNLNE